MINKTTKSEYELQRLARLKRNQEVMKSLGLATSVPNRGGHTKPNASRARPKPVEADISQVERRQSKRLQELPRTDFREPNVYEPKKNARDSDDDNVEVEKSSDSRPIVRAERTLYPTSENSVKIEGFSIGSRGEKSCPEIDLHIDKLDDEWVGRVFYPPPNIGAMKETVMKQVARENPIFSKYSGLQEFRNGLVVFANVGGRDYENVFHEEKNGAVSMDWFASVKVKPDSKVAQRLSDTSTRIFLFLRFEGEPYLCSGPVELIESDIRKRPMRFRLKLIKADVLRARAASLFNQLLKGEREDETLQQ